MQLEKSEGYPLKFFLISLMTGENFLFEINNMCITVYLYPVRRTAGLIIRCDKNTHFYKLLYSTRATLVNALRF